MKKLIALIMLFGVTLYGAVGLVIDKEEGIVSVPNVATTADLSLKANATGDNLATNFAANAGLVKQDSGTATNLTVAGTLLKSAGAINVELGVDVSATNSSAAFGYNTTASGNYSAAFGNSTIASGYCSAAFGDSTIASDYSAAFGYITTASDCSAAFGYSTTASGFGSAAFGENTTASGYYSAAFGYRGKAIHAGATVFADFQNADFNSETNDTFNVRASNGVYFATSGAGLTVDGTNIVAEIALKADTNGSNSVFNVANFVDNYQSTNWTAILSWDASNKVFTVSESGVAE